MNQNSDGQIDETESISAGLDYPGVSPLHCFLKDTKRARYAAASDEDALEAYKLVTKFENLNPSLEPSHAFAEVIKTAPKLSKDTIIIVNSCGDAKKDRDIIKKRLGKNMTLISLALKKQKRKRPALSYTVAGIQIFKSLLKF